MPRCSPPTYAVGVSATADDHVPDDRLNAYAAPVFDTLLTARIGSPTIARSPEIATPSMANMLLFAGATGSTAP